MAAAVDIDGGKNPTTAVDVDGGKNPAALRWIDAVRYTVALVVAVLIVSVIVNAIKFVLRSDPLHVSVVGGFVSTARLSPPPNRLLALDLNIRAQNPSGRTRMFYVHIAAYFFDSGRNSTSAWTSSDLVYDSMAFSRKIPDMAIPQQSAMDSSVHLIMKNSSMPEYFDSLYGGRHMSDVTLRLDGNLTTEVFGTNTTVPTTYYCEDLLLGGDRDDEAFKGRPDVFCQPSRST